MNSMANDKGSALAIVMLILAVTSLAGVALLMQSRLDIRFSTSVASYNKMFSLADGASAMAVTDLRNVDREVQYSGNEVEIYCVDSNKDKIMDRSVPQIGSYSASVKLAGYSTHPADAAGWEIDTFYPEYWAGQGLGKRRSALFRTITAPTSTVHTAVIKLKRKM